MRRKRGIARSSTLAQAVPRRFAMGRGAYSSNETRIWASPASRALRRAERFRNLFDPTTGDDEVARIKHGCLPGGHGRLRLIEARFGASFGKRVQGGGRGNMPVANANPHAHRL